MLLPGESEKEWKQFHRQMMSYYCEWRSRDSPSR
jgi:hypothetical protein